MCVGRIFLFRCGHIKEEIRQRCLGYNPATRRCEHPSRLLGGPRVHDPASIVIRFQSNCLACMLDQLELVIGLSLQRPRDAVTNSMTAYTADPTNSNFIRAVEKMEALDRAHVEADRTRRHYRRKLAERWGTSVRDLGGDWRAALLRPRTP
ncbi:MAG: hypothetical protein M1826_005754 [Phylliscum demangeonii]|nr:MAG: hypothetical protein M1826_005754 [Phylliscum demangeonii]